MEMAMFICDKVLMSNRKEKEIALLGDPPKDNEELMGKTKKEIQNTDLALMVICSFCIACKFCQSYVADIESDLDWGKHVFHKDNRSPVSRRQVLEMEARILKCIDGYLPLSIHPLQWIHETQLVKNATGTFKEMLDLAAVASLYPFYINSGTACKKVACLLKVSLGNIMLS